MSVTIRHPAKFSDALLPVMAKMLREAETDIYYVLDPFAGTGKIFDLLNYGPSLLITAVEIEPDYAALDPRIMVGDALNLPFENGFFDAICTSPTYGNRLADHHNPRDGSKRYSYKFSLGHDLHPNNSGALQWGEEYREFHAKAWLEARRVLRIYGTLVLNIKDHIRNGVRQEVTAWHIQCLTNFGFQLEHHAKVPTPGLRHGRNSGARIDHDSIIRFTLMER